MANKKFSEFTSQTDSANVQFVVGYNGSDNVRISPSNLLGAYLPLAGGTLTGNLVFNDNGKAIFGADDDLEIYHDGNDSFITFRNTDVKIQQLGTDKKIIFQCDDGSGGVTSYLTFDGNTTHSYFSAGNVGIGTTSPGTKLEVNGLISGKGGAGWGYTFSGDLDTSIENPSANTIGFKTTNVERMRIDSSGNVGIGSTTPTAKLQVVGLAEHADNSAATTAGLTAGAFYRTGDLLKVVH